MTDILKHNNVIKKLKNLIYMKMYLLILFSNNCILLLDNNFSFEILLLLLFNCILKFSNLLINILRSFLIPSNVFSYDFIFSSFFNIFSFNLFISLFNISFLFLKLFISFNNLLFLFWILFILLLFIFNSFL